MLNFVASFAGAILGAATQATGLHWSPRWRQQIKAAIISFLIGVAAAYCAGFLH
jgi:hypothetical protein